METFGTTVLDAELARSIETAECRRSQFMSAIPPELSNREDKFQRKLALENSSALNKLRKIFSLIDELGKAAGSYVACGRGCSACCNINVMVSQLEASFIEKETGVKSVQVTNSQSHREDEFLGRPCSFLDEGSCSIYEARPFACRKHWSFDASAYWCDPARAFAANLPMLGFSGAEGAYFDATRIMSGGVFADIRDFFP